MAKPSLSLIIPAHNEAARLPKTLTEVQAFLSATDETVEVLLVENASSDETLAIARSWEQQIPALRVISLPSPGKGQAVREGMSQAQGAIKMMADADLSMPLSEVPKFTAAIRSGTHLAIASREATGAKRIGEPLHRHLIGRAFNALVKLLLLPGLQDTQCGFKAFTAHAAETIFTRQTLDGWGFDLEVLTIAREHQLSIQEVPITWYYGQGSHISVARDSFKMLGELLQIRKKRRDGAYR